MNGHIYDPGLGRFLQADPLIQDLSNPQSLNRYSHIILLVMCRPEADW